MFEKWHYQNEVGCKAQGSVVTIDKEHEEAKINKGVSNLYIEWAIDGISNINHRADNQHTKTANIDDSSDFDSNGRNGLFQYEN